MRIGTVNPLASATGQACQGFADAVAASPTLSSVLQVDVIAGGTLGGELEMTQACINGSLDLAVCWVRTQDLEQYGPRTASSFVFSGDSEDAEGAESDVRSQDSKVVLGLDNEDVCWADVVEDGPEIEDYEDFSFAFDSV